LSRCLLLTQGGSYRKAAISSGYEGTVRSISREWQSLVDVLNTVARVRAEQGELQAFRIMQQQAMRVGMRRVELRMRMAELEGPPPG